MEIIRDIQKENREEILARPNLKSEDIDEVINQIFAEIEQDGDAAIQKYTWFFDQVKLEELEVSESEIQEAEVLVSDELKKSIALASCNIEKFHASQRIEEKKVQISQGITCWQKQTAIEKVGLYVPGGSAPLFSTVLMLGIPAKLAGCKEILLCTPPNKEGKINPVILYAAKQVGVTKIYKIGGIQAIGGMSVGTKSVLKVDKIFGPGNQFVTAAKQFAIKKGVAIDMPAGPSEVLVIADESAKAEFIAADLLSQAEHGADSQVLFVSWKESLLASVKENIDKQLQALSRKSIAEKSLQNSKLILVKSREEALELSNFYAPEHLIVSVKDENYFIENISNAGSVFIGNYTPESAGDYASGTNHTLPTNGFAKSYSGLGLSSFMKSISFQKISENSLLEIGSAIECMAKAESLDAHANAVRIRLNQMKG